jgi:hypothetical protein
MGVKSKEMHKVSYWCILSKVSIPLVVKLGNSMLIPCTAYI